MNNTILTQEVISEILRLDNAGKMYAIINTIVDFVSEGIEVGRFSQEEALHDLEIALWVAYANNNIDDYLHYANSESWLKRVEDLATGCGKWYYRYASALIHLGRLDEALQYAEEGVRQEPDYPWGWLTLSALRAHAGDKQGALDAVAKGLELVPGDYEFLQRRDEIEAGCSIEVMESHFIDPDADAMLKDTDNRQRDEERIAKQLSASTILCDSDNLNRIKQILAPVEWDNSGHFCYFTIALSGCSLSGRFVTNEAGLSKFDTAWIAQLKSSLDTLIRDAYHWLDRMARKQVDVATLRLHSIEINLDRSIEINFSIAAESDADLYCVYFNDKFEINLSTPKNFYPETYAEEDKEIIEKHIIRHWGDYDGVFHEMISPDIHIDIYIVKPAPERNYYTLITVGMGAHLMTLPENISAQQWGRAELVICLPPDWEIQNSDERWYWPIRSLKTLARLPISNDTFLAQGHTIPKGEPLADNTLLSGFILTKLQNVPAGADRVTLHGGDDVNFYQAVPIYDEEMNYKLEYGDKALLKLLHNVGHVVDIDRINLCGGLFFTPFRSDDKYKN